MLTSIDQDGTGVGFGLSVGGGVGEGTVVGATVGVGNGVDGITGVVVRVDVEVVQANSIAANATKMRTVSCIPRNIPTKPLMAMGSRRIWA